MSIYLLIAEAAWRQAAMQCTSWRVVEGAMPGTKLPDSGGAGGSRQANSYSPQEGTIAMQYNTPIGPYLIPFH